MRATAGVLTVLAAALVAGCGSEGFEASKPNMEPTLKVGEKFEVDRNAYRDDVPRIGDIVLFHPPEGANDDTCGDAAVPAGQICPRPSKGSSGDTFVDRVVALPGDRVSLRGGKLIRNGRPAVEPYAQPCSEARDCDLPRTTVIPRGHFLLLGDNRGASDDSRFWGPVRVGAIIGKVKKT